MGWNLPTFSPTLIMSLGKPSNGRKVGKGRRKVLLSHWVTELLVNINDEGAFRSPSAHVSVLNLILCPLAMNTFAVSKQKGWS